MPRNLDKPPQAGATGAASALLLLAALLAASPSGPAQAQGKTPARPVQPSAAAAPAPAPTPAIGAYPERHAEIWATAIQYVYSDDPELAKISSALLLTADGASLKTVARGLDEATKIEQDRLPGQKHVLTLQGVYKDIEAQKPATLPALVQTIETKLASNPERMQDPARRQRLTALLAQLRQAAAAPQLPFPDRVEPADGPGAPLAALTPAATPASAASAALALPAPAPYPPAAPEAASSWLPMLSLVLSALSLLGVVYLLLNRGRGRRSSSARMAGSAGAGQSSAGLGFNLQQYEEMRKEVQREVEQQVAKLRGLPPAATQLIAQLQPEPRPVAPPALAAAAPVAPVATAIVSPAPSPAPSLESITAEPAAAAQEAALPAPPTPQLRIIYVNQQPLDGAFRRDNLADAPASYTIFEITVDAQTPDQGTFAVTRNEAAHGGYIGSHHSILEPACTYNYPQGPVSRIITDVPGTVQRLASGDWQIIRKAQIHFA